MTDQLLWTMAFDHRNSLRTSFFGLTGPEGEADRERAVAAKQLVFEALLQAVARGIPAGQPAILIDEEYGADVLTTARRHGIATAVPVEASGNAVLEFAAGDDGFGPALERVDPTYAKVLVRYNPGDDPGARALQLRRLVALQDWVGDHGRQWMLELLVPPTSAQLAATGHDGAAAAERYDLDVRPALTAAVADEFVAHGLAPQLWKLEGMASADEYAAIAAAAGADGSSSGCLVLGRGADEAAVDRWLSLAAPVAGFTGFAVGRTLWWQPLRATLDGTITRDEAVTRIADNYLRLIDVYLDARADAPAS